jgi:hypothetical protein
VPDSTDTPPQPSSDLIRHVCDQLNNHRLLTTELFVKGPEYQEIKVEVRVAAEPYAPLDSVARNVKNAINEYLDPLGRHKNLQAQNGVMSNEIPVDDNSNQRGGWNFGQELYPTNLFSEILRVGQVAAVRSLGITVNGRPHTNLTDPVIVPHDGLVYGSDDHEIVVVPLTDL